MSHSVIEANSGRQLPKLRSDLAVIADPKGLSRYRIIACDISQTFTRTTAAVWETLRGQLAAPEAWAQARQAGWTRSRQGTLRRRYSLLAIRIPLFHVGPVSDWSARHTGWLFSPPAIATWLAILGIAMTVILIRMPAFISDVSRLPAFLSQIHPVIPIAGWVLTKVAHEWGHAVVCRRIGAMPGRVGVFLFCGIPCPYCDVTDIWRETSSAKRAAVMAAGIYVELVIAVIATFVWLACENTGIRLFAVNVIVVCSISTLLFNANPLMRYDGYYLLADLINSVNLRQEASESFRDLLIKAASRSARLSRFRLIDRGTWLAIYHVAATAYRATVLLAIAGIMMWALEKVGAAGLGILLIVLAMMRIGFDKAIQLRNVVRGDGRWSAIPPPRRYALMIGLGILVAAILFVPLPRYRYATGHLDAADAATIYLPDESLLKEVHVDFGDHVSPGQLLARVDDTSQKTESIRLRIDYLAAQQASKAARSVAVRANDRQMTWLLADSMEQSIHKQWLDAESRLEATRIVSPRAGQIIPASAHLKMLDRKTSDDTRQAGCRLSNQVGQPVAPELGWCRVARSHRLTAVLVLDAASRNVVRPGAPVTLSVLGWSGKTIRTHVESVSPSDQQTPTSLWQEASFQITCPVPMNDEEDGSLKGGVLSELGGSCRAAFHLPPICLFERMNESFRRWLQS